ncbi:MAG: phosphotransferase, partial [Nostocoides sp.]
MTEVENTASFAEEVRSSAWRAETDAWIAARLAESGRRPSGPTEQRRIRPWSIQLVAPTVEGPAWFKADAPGLAHEPALHALLASIAPDRVDAPLAIDTGRGWMLTRDRGSTLADDHDASLEEWCEIVREAADLQRRVVPHAASLLRTGLPNCSPTTVLERFDVLIDRYAALPPSHPSHLSIDERQAFEAVRSDVAEAAATLAAGALPVTLDHGDLHPGNVLLVGGGLRLFDFGDAQWASAPETLGA